MRKAACVSAGLLFSLFAWGGEDPLKGVFSSVGVELGGRLKADMSYDDSRTHPGNYTVWVENEETADKDDDEFNATANESRLWLTFHGPRTNGIKTGGKVEFDFYGSNAPENKAKLQLRRAYITCSWERYGLTVLAGQHSDIISPLVPTTLNYTVGWYIGNIGYRRPQVRVEKECDFGDFDLVLTGGLSRTIGGHDLAGGRDDYGEDSGVPTMQGRIGVALPGIKGKPISAGVSSHYGEEQLESNKIVDRCEAETYSFNVDLRVPVRLTERLDFELSGEWYYGKNVNTYFGGIGQGINTDTGKEITSKGGWGQVAYNGLNEEGFSFAAGGGVDNPQDGELAGGAGGDPADRSCNEFIFANVRYSITKNLQVGAEYGWYKTSYYQQKDARANRVQGSMIYSF